MDSRWHLATNTYFRSVPDDVSAWFEARRACVSTDARRRSDRHQLGPRPARPCPDNPCRRASESFATRALGMARQAWRATAAPFDVELTEDEGTFLSR